MTLRNWILSALLAVLGVIYVVFFTEWLHPAPIEIASQVRFAIQPPRFGRATKKPSLGQGIKVVRQGDQRGSLVSKKTPQVVWQDPPQGIKVLRKVPESPAQRNALPDEVERIGAPEKGTLEEAPEGSAHVTFSLDAWYELTRVRVEDVPADGTAPKVFWQLVGKSLRVNSLLYGRDPQGMKPLLPDSAAEPLLPGVPYRLMLEAGRRRGTNKFTTVAVQL